MMTVLLIAYGCLPGEGSEEGKSWNWATRLAERNNVYILTPTDNRAAIMAALTGRPSARLHFVFADLPPPFNRGSERWIFVRYVVWQVCAYLAALRLRLTVRFDVVHHISWGTFDGPTLGWALGAPFIWGPLGGGQVAPTRLRQYFGRAWRSELMRTARVRAVRFYPWTQLAARRAAIALASNYETLDALRGLGSRDARLLVSPAVEPDWGPVEFPRRPTKAAPAIIWLGNLEPRKAPTLAIECFAAARQKTTCELWIIGDGPLLRECRELVARLNVDRDVRFLGHVPHGEVPKYLARADILLFTSLRDTFAAALLEGMAWGLPTVLLDQQASRLLPGETALKVPVSEPAEVVRGLSLALLRLIESLALREAIGRAAWEYVRAEHLWPSRVEYMQTLYASVVRTRPPVPAGQR